MMKGEFNISIANIGSLMDRADGRVGVKGSGADLGRVCIWLIRI